MRITLAIAILKAARAARVGEVPESRRAGSRRIAVQVDDVQEAPGQAPQASFK